MPGTRRKLYKILLCRCAQEFKHDLIHYSDQLSIVDTDSGELTHIMAKGVSKGTAIAALCRKKGISMDQAMAFGDDWNDLDLFKACGTSIAMGNAVPGLENDATMRTGTNDEDGVAQVLEKLVNQISIQNG